MSLSSLPLGPWPVHSHSHAWCTRRCVRARAWHRTHPTCFVLRSNGQWESDESDLIQGPSQTKAHLSLNPASLHCREEVYITPSALTSSHRCQATRTSAPPLQVPYLTAARRARPGQQAAAYGKHVSCFRWLHIFNQRDQNKTQRRFASFRLRSLAQPITSNIDNFQLSSAAVCRACEKS